MSTQWRCPGHRYGDPLPSSGAGIGRMTPCGIDTTFAPAAWQNSSSASASATECIGTSAATVMRSRYGP